MAAVIIRNVNLFKNKINFVSKARLTDKDPHCHYQRM